ETRFLVETKLFHATLSRPQRGSEGRGQVAVVTIEGRVKRHAIIVYVSLYIALKPRLANFPSCFWRQIPRTTIKPLGSRPHCSHRQSRHETGTINCQRLHDLPAQREAHGMTPGNFQILQKPRAILTELAYTVTVGRFTATSRSATIKNDGPIALRKALRDPDIPGVARPPRWRHQQGRFAFALGFIVNF